MSYMIKSLGLIWVYFLTFVYYKGDLEQYSFLTGECRQTKLGNFLSKFNHSQVPICGFFPHMDECVAHHLKLETLLSVSTEVPVFQYGFEDGCHVQGSQAICGGFPCPYTIPFSSCMPKNFTFGFCDTP